MDGRRLSQLPQNIPQPPVEVHIGELVLEGFPSMDQTQVGAVVQQELSRLFAEGGVPAGLARQGGIAGLDGGDFQLVPDSNAQAIGSRIAQAVYGGLSR